MSTTLHRPPMRTSDEATEKQLEMAAQQGETYKAALTHMAEEVADVGATKRVGDYVVAFAAENAEGMYEMHDGELTWHAPDEENVHIEITACDGADGRFVPGLTVYVTLTDEDGHEIGRHQQPFLWHPWLYHYGRNWKIPGDGAYTVDVEIKAPDFPRHDHENGNRFAHDVRVKFEKVQLKTGQK